MQGAQETAASDCPEQAITRPLPVRLRCSLPGNPLGARADLSGPHSAFSRKDAPLASGAWLMAPSNVNNSIKGSAGKRRSLDSSAAAGEPEWPGAAEIWTAVERHQPHADMCEAMVVAGWLAGMGLEAYTKKLLEEGWNCLEVGPGIFSGTTS
jgi:hypothetical protein